MDLSNRERKWASNIKAAAQAAEDIDTSMIPDMDFALYAFVDHNNVAQALDRIRGIQTFRELYQLDDSVDQAIEILRAFVKKQPGHCLDIDTSPDTQEGIIILDLASFQVDRVFASSPADCARTSRNWEIHVVAIYYLMRALQPCLESAREGTYMILECEGFQAASQLARFAICLNDELCAHFAYFFKKIQCYHTGCFANLFFSMLKSVTRNKDWDLLQLGCRIEDEFDSVNVAATTHTLRELYLQPSVEEAHKHFLKRVGELLAQRRSNALAFRL
ncbi:expressed unknown protein [Seminavis robusta]|uniref:Uncharacterized protein n=1 Tax=Seminavis robusta TaxID=568900 RepID=A0A9N8DXE2_9STRA|nr:expressed unknown protein [Seminavis robusta]|eukprot:Sro438_g143080.1 n/a (276) ;mRNA; f:42396-43223